MRAVVGGTATVTYLHGDHLGSVSVTSNAAGAVTGGQLYDPYGRVRGGGPLPTTLGFTGQRQDDTGLLYYGARYYDPTLGRFASADSIVPSSASGKGGAAATLGQDGMAALRPLAVDFHEPGFASGLALENASTQAKGFWFQLTQEDKQRGEGAKLNWGPLNPQALNRYSYVFNNPLRYTDPNGHFHQEKYWWGTSATLEPEDFKAIGDRLVIAGGVDFTLGFLAGGLARLLGLSGPEAAAIAAFLWFNVMPVFLTAGTAAAAAGSFFQALGNQCFYVEIRGLVNMPGCIFWPHISIGQLGSIHGGMRLG